MLSPFKPQATGGPADGLPTADRSKDGSGALSPTENRQQGARVVSSNVQGAVAPPRGPFTRYIPIEVGSMSVPLPVTPMRDLFPLAWQQLMRDLRAIRRRRRWPPPPGSVKLSGWVNVETSKYLVCMDVQAFYVPEMDKFDGRTLSCNVWSAQRIRI